VHAPFGVVLSRDETYVIIADYGGNVLRKLVVSSGYVTTIVTGTTFYRPTGLAIDANNNVYVTDSNRVLKIDEAQLTPDGTATVIAGSVTAGNLNGECLSSDRKLKSGSAATGTGSSATGSAAVSGSSATGSAASGSSASTGSTSSSGSGSTSGGSPGSGSSSGSSGEGSGNYPGSYTGSYVGAGTDGKSCKFNTPIGIAVNNDKGVIYVADSGNNAIYQIGISSPYEVTKFAASSLLKFPFGLAFDDWYLYVTSFKGHNIYRFDATQFLGTAFEVSIQDVYAGSSIGK